MLGSLAGVKARERRYLAVLHHHIITNCHYPLSPACLEVCTKPSAAAIRWQVLLMDDSRAARTFVGSIWAAQAGASNAVSQRSSQIWRIFLTSHLPLPSPFSGIGRRGGEIRDTCLFPVVGNSTGFSAALLPFNSITLYASRYCPQVHSYI